jgi:hypothetical protein
MKKEDYTKTQYDTHRQIMAQKSRETAAAGRDIGELPEVVNPERKESCKLDFKLFCESYFPEMFPLAWSDDHLKCIERIETSVLQGGLFALALPRGSGKTTLAECACKWAMCYGHREFIVLIGATETAATEMLDSLKSDFEANELLAEDFPEICYPIAMLEGIAHRCAGQTYHGERTKITWTANEIVLPTIAGSVSSEIVVRVAGITGRIRGMKHKRADGKNVRPSLVIVDDPQTRESAGSFEQNRKRVQILSGDILGLAGPGQKISGIMPCTIIQQGDMAEQILDRKAHPEWQGEKAKMLYEFPTNTKLWEEYAELWGESLRIHGNIQLATAFYKQHREQMDDGAKVYWEDRYNPDEISAIQHAMNLKLRDEIAFYAEYQNEPLLDAESGDFVLSTSAIMAKANGLPQGTLPQQCDKVVMFVDVQKTLLFYTVVAWNEDFTGQVLEYGTYPKQNKRRFTLADAGITIQQKFPKAGFEGQLTQALTALFTEQMRKEWQREDGIVFHIEKALIDANWGQSTDIVYQFCRRNPFAGAILPSHGRYIGASSKPMTEYRKQPGDKLGFNWLMPNIFGKRTIRHVVFDTNYWKSFVYSRLAVAEGDKGCLSLYGKPALHELFAQHLTAEYRVKTEGRGRTVDEWKLKPEHFDNHWFDCLVGCAVLGSMQGCALPEHFMKGRANNYQSVNSETETPQPPPPVTAKKQISLREIYEQKRNR